MKSLCLLLALVAVASASRLQPLRFSPLTTELNEMWENYKHVHGKVYTLTEEEVARRMIWEHNLKKIQHHNLEYDLGKHTYFLGMNKFADLTSEEFVQLLSPMNRSAKVGKSGTFLKPSNIGDLPDTVDWRKQGYVTPVKNQGQCGSCWSFSATGSLEGQHFKKTGQLISLSEQQLVDCSKKFGNNGCNGGLMDNAFKYIAANNGIDTEDSYPYEAKDGKCRFDPANVAATDIGPMDINSGDEGALKTAVATVGPISVAIDAGHDSFQLYSGGVYNEPDCSSTELDHGVLAVGYGTDNGQDYWLVKNSWGEGWGTAGYIMMSRNKNNQCGIATMASYPSV